MTRLVLASFMGGCAAVIVAALAVVFLIDTGDANASEPAVNQTQVFRVPGSNDSDKIRVIKPLINGNYVTCVLYDGYAAVAIDCLEGS